MYGIISYTRYTRAFCQTGLPSTLATACWTKSRNMQQKGASRVITKRPAQICQMPATMQSGEKEMQHQNPKNTATARRRQKWLSNSMTDGTRIRTLTYSTANSCSFSSIPHPPWDVALRTTPTFAAASTWSHVREEILHFFNKTSTW